MNAGPGDGRHRSRLRSAVSFLLLFQGLSGLAGGLGLVLDPSGASLGLPLQLLGATPFRDYLVPGLVLLVALGALPCLVAYLVWAGRSGGRLAALAVGLALVVWIGVQVVLIGYQADPPLQAVYGAVGVVITGLAALLPAKETNSVSAVT